VPNIATFTALLVTSKVVALHSTARDQLVFPLSRTFPETPPTLSEMLIRMVMACP